MQRSYLLLVSTKITKWRCDYNLLCITTQDLDLVFMSKQTLNKDWHICAWNTHKTFEMHASQGQDAKLQRWLDLFGYFSFVLFGGFERVLLAKDATQAVWTDNKIGMKKKGEQKKENQVLLKCVTGRKTLRFNVNLLRLFLKIWDWITLSSNIYTELQSTYLKRRVCLEEFEVWRAV